jgi:uncharacterized protein YcbK (DUF882 family)
MSKGKLVVFGGLLAALALGGTRRRAPGVGSKEKPPDGPLPEPPPELEPTLDALDRLLRERGITNFAAKELVWLSKAKPPHHDIPPTDLWPNLVRVAKLAQRIRNVMGVPLSVSSAWRPRWYNDAVGGSENSAHLRGAAIDLNLVSGNRTPEEIERFRVEVARFWLTDPETFHGIGFYKSPKYRIHIDVAHPGSKGHRRWTKSLVDPYLEKAQA